MKFLQIDTSRVLYPTFNESVIPVAGEFKLVIYLSMFVPRLIFSGYNVINLANRQLACKILWIYLVPIKLPNSDSAIRPFIPSPPKRHTYQKCDEIAVLILILTTWTIYSKNKQAFNSPNLYN